MNREDFDREKRLGMIRRAAERRQHRATGYWTDPYGFSSIASDDIMVSANTNDKINIKNLMQG